jgi:predicted DNA-binding protein (MmcQ/YjbR family)
MDTPTVEQLYRAIHDHCAAAPLARERRRFGETLFTVRGRTFAFLDLPRPPTVTVKVEREELDALLALPFVRRARHVGPLGWVTVSVSDEPSLRVALDLVDRSYAMRSR